MIEFECTVQEGCVDDALRPSLAAAIEKASNEVLGADQGPVDFRWTVIPKGFGFRGGTPSTTSLVRGRIPDGCSRETRASYLRAIADSWCEISGQDEHELMVSARDQGWAG